MSKPNKSQNRRHFIPERMLAAGMKKTNKKTGEIEPVAAKLVTAMNADPSQTIIDKSQVHRWLKGQTPQYHMQVRIAVALGLFDKDGQPDTDALFMHPELEWVARRLAAHTPKQVETFKKIVDVALPEPTDG